MILSYKDCIERFGSHYKLDMFVAEGKIYKLEAGIYSTDKFPSDLEVIFKKYPHAVLTGESAFYVHGLTDVIPEKYWLATKSKAAPIKSDKINQVFVREDLLPLGAAEKSVDGVSIPVYDKERMLIELLRSKNTMPYDLYKEIIGRYRKIINELEIWRIQEYAAIFPKSKMISKALDEEVF
ncbi:MAG: hypothetical protein Q4D07_05800 [Selenomonadaceae bacterium]|nr:hypothetical protein [Selenomonadaceae bacterium]